MDSIFDRINAREQAAKERGDNQRRLKATAEEKNKEAFDCFLNKVSISPQDNGDVTVNKFDCSIIVVFFLPIFSFKSQQFFRSMQAQTETKPMPTFVQMKQLSLILIILFLVEK